MKKKGIPLFDKHYKSFLTEIKSKIISARISAARRINKKLIKLYWDIGKTIVDRQKQYGWGQSVVEKLAVDLVREFGAGHGFSANNLWRMRTFYLTYYESKKLAQLVQEMPWGHNIVIMQMVKNLKEQEYYIVSSIELGWSRNVLLNQIKANAYNIAKKVPKQHNFPKALPAHLAEQADESLKSVYNLDFLGITKPILERELEKRLTEKVKHFILELGGHLGSNLYIEHKIKEDKMSVWLVHHYVIDYADIRICRVYRVKSQHSTYVQNECMVCSWREL